MHAIGGVVGDEGLAARLAVHREAERLAALARRAVRRPRRARVDRARRLGDGGQPVQAVGDQRDRPVLDRSVPVVSVVVASTLALTVEHRT
ncbi:MAG TPA: hypothetical protein VM734_29245, partial [Kofleriaceae bacterium]|nr:hypothetical protein [Kofleriaceae bacterium]